jgi:hypothetical protein
MNIHQRLPWILLILLGLCASNVFAPAARAQSEKLEIGVDYNCPRQWASGWMRLLFNEWRKRLAGLPADQ